MPMILVAEDTQSVREAIRTLLESEYYSVLTATNGCEALDLFWKYQPEAVVLDIMMPNMSGLDVCRSIRAGDLVTPIMFLSAKADEADKVLGLGLGADDYLAKPFGSNEFIARIAALMRRAQAGRKETAQLAIKKDLNTFRVGKAVVRGVELVFINSDGIRIGITHREYMLLRLLSLRPGEIVTKEEIQDVLWGADYLPNSRTLEQHLYNLRRKVAGNGFSITTVPNLGLRFDLRD